MSTPDTPGPAAGRALPEWPAMQHAVPVPTVTCRLCLRMQPASAFPPSELRSRIVTNGHGRQAHARAQRRCRRCIRQAHRRYYGNRPQRRYASEAAG